MSNLSTQFKSKDFTPRTKESHNYHCSLLSGNLSREYSKISCFHVIGQLPQDIMHVLFEGVVPYELSLLLVDFVTVRKYFSIDTLNDRMTCFEYTNEEARDKPTLINSQKLRQLNQSCELEFQ